MAIAYFIPDQGKLLQRSGNATDAAGQTATTTNSHAQASTAASPTTSSSTSPSGAAAASAGINGQRQCHHFRANITITPFEASRHTVGCWDLITHVFCYALRLYRCNHTEPPATPPAPSSTPSTGTTTSMPATPTMIEISFEIRDGTITSTTVPATHFHYHHHHHEEHTNQQQQQQHTVNGNNAGAHPKDSV